MGGQSADALVPTRRWLRRGTDRRRHARHRRADSVGRAVRSARQCRGPVRDPRGREQTVEESPYGWLVEDVRVRDIIPSGVAGFVHGSPADGIITLDLIGWDPEQLRSTVAHEIGHLLDFAAYGQTLDRRDGLESEVWAECAAVDAGFRRTDPEGADQVYRCTATELDQYRFAVSRLGEVCSPWNGECRVVTPIGG